jgi:hypothetical protein
MQLWRLLEGGGEGRDGLRRSCGFSVCESCGRGDGGINIVPDDFIEHRSEERGMICSMSKLPELTAKFSSNRSPKRFMVLPLEGSVRDVGKTANVRDLSQVDSMPYLHHWYWAAHPGLR